MSDFHSICHYFNYFSPGTSTMASPADDPWATTDDSFSMYNVKMAALKTAAENGEADLLKKMIPEWADDVVLLNEGLFLAASNGHMDCLRLLLQAGAQATYWDSSCDETVLSTAAAHGHSEVLNFLLSLGNDGGLAVKGDKHTPLHSAAKEGHLGCVQILLSRRVLVDSKDTFGFTPLMVASKAGFPDVVKALLEANADPKIKTRVRKETAFTMAVDEDRAGCVQELLIACPEEATQEFKGGLLPMHHAIRYEKCEVVCAMIDAGVDINATDGLWTPVHLALETGNVPLVNILAACGAKINEPLPLPKDVTLLMLAVTKNSPQMVSALADKPNCNVDQFDELGRTALYLAAKFGYTECLNILIANGADLDAYASHMVEKKKNTGTGSYPAATPIHAAIMNDCPEAGIALTGAGCDANFAAFYEEDGVVNMFTPLQVACLKNSEWAVSMLLEVVQNIPRDICKWCRHHGTDSPVYIMLNQAVTSKTKSAPTLKRYCRKYLRGALGNFHLRQKIQDLGLPQSLRDYMLYADLNVAKREA